MHTSDLPLKSGVADVVLLCEVLEYIGSLPESLNEIHRILKPNGIFILSWPYLHPMHNPSKGDIARYTKDYLNLLLSPQYSVIESLSMGSYFSIFVDLIRPRLSSVTKQSFFYIPSRILFFFVTLISLIILPFELNRSGLCCRDTTGYFMILRRI